MRTYVVEAGSSPTSTAARPAAPPRSLSAPISRCNSVRIASPTAAPSMILAGKIHRAGLADHHDLDLPGVLQLPLDLAGDLLRELARLAVVDGVGRDHDPDLPDCLDRVHLLDARGRARELLELRHPLDVALERLSAGPAPRDTVGRV